MKSYGVTIQMKATEQYVPVVLYYYAVHVWNPVVQPLHLNPFSSTWHGAICFLSYYKYILSIFWLSLGVRKG